MNIVNIVAVLIGLMSCFFGYKLNKTLIAIMGLIIGFNLGIVVLPNFITDQTIIYIVSAIIALLFGFISYNLYLVGIFLLCAITVYYLCNNLGLESNIQTIISVISGIIAGILGVKFTRPLMIISTSLGGASLITENAFNLFNFQNNILSIIVLIIIAVLGMSYQFKQPNIN